MGFAIGGGIAAGALISGVASSNASSTMAGSSRQAVNMQGALYSETERNETPYMNAGKNAVGQIMNNMPEYNRPFQTSDFHADPGYEFNLSEGQRAIEQGSAGKSGLLSGNEMAAASKYSQGLASTEYQNAYNRYQNQITNSYNRLLGIGTLGQAAAGQNAAAAGNFANSASNAMIAGGEAQAAGQVGMANAFTGAIGQGVGAYQNSQLVNALSGRNASTASTYNPASNFQPTQLQEPNVGDSASALY